MRLDHCCCLFTTFRQSRGTNRAKLPRTVGSFALHASEEERREESGCCVVAAVNCTFEAFFSRAIQWLILRWLNFGLLSSRCCLLAYVSGWLISLSSHKSDTFPPYQRQVQKVRGWLSACSSSILVALGVARLTYLISQNSSSFEAGFKI